MIILKVIDLNILTCLGKSCDLTKWTEQNTRFGWWSHELYLIIAWLSMWKWVESMWNNVEYYGVHGFYRINCGGFHLDSREITRKTCDMAYGVLTRHSRNCQRLWVLRGMMWDGSESKWWKVMAETDVHWHVKQVRWPHPVGWTKYIIWLLTHYVFKFTKLIT